MPSRNAIVFVILLIFFSSSVYTQRWKMYSDSAQVFNDHKNADSAIALYTKAIEVLKQDSMLTNSYAELCSKLAGICTDRSQYQKAEQLYLEAKNIKEKVFGKEHPEYTQSCIDLGNLYRAIDQYQKAEPVYLEAKQIREKTLGKNSAEYASCCDHLGRLYQYMGQYEKVEPLLVEAKEIRERVLGKEHPDYAHSCNNLGTWYASLGQFQKSEALQIEAKQIREKVLGKSHSEYAQSCNNLAVLYMTMGQYEKAEPLLLESKQIREILRSKEQSDMAHDDYANSCNNLAVLYFRIGQYQKSESLQLEARAVREKVFGKQHRSYAQSCNNLASLFMAMGQFKKAEPLLVESQQIREKVLGKEHSEYALGCNSLANLYRQTGQYAKAEPLYLQAKQIWEKALGTGHADYARICNNLAQLYRITGRYQQAESLFLEGKQIWEKVMTKEHPDYVQSCINFANLYWNLKQPQAAYRLYAEAIAAQNSQVNRIFAFTSEQEKQAYLATIADLANNYFSFTTSVPSDTLQGLSYDVSLFHRNLILSSSQQLRNRIYYTDDTTIKNKYQAWTRIREQLSFWYSKPVSKRPAALVTGLESQANTLEKELTRFSTAFNFEQAKNRITWKNIQQQLQPHEAAIEFVQFHYYEGKRWTDSTFYMALVLRKDQSAPLLVPLFESRRLQNLIYRGNTLNTVYALYRSNRDQPTSAYNLIWKPIEAHLKGITRIYFAPAGFLYRIAFAALPVNGHQVLSDKYELVQLNTTAGVTNRTERYIDTANTISLYGGIKYDIDPFVLKQAVVAFPGSSTVTAHFLSADLTRGTTWQYLPGTEKEIYKISRLGKERHHTVVLSSGASASEESLKALNGAASPAILHIATHGFFFPDPKASPEKALEQRTALGNVFRQSDNPLFRSGLLFAGANRTWKGEQVQGIEDGILTAYEVSNMYLPKTKLVVLSACETGLGDVQGNEGVYGLQRAFKMAGVENLVMSLWKIPDQVAAEFMQEFYKRIFDGKAVQDAFYMAQTVLKNRYRKEPYKWAAWILVR